MVPNPLPDTVRLWLGDPVGTWEGDTLAVDTTNFSEKSRFRNSGERLHVVERFTRVDKNTIEYRVTCAPLARSRTTRVGKGGAPS